MKTTKRRAFFKTAVFIAIAGVFILRGVQHTFAQLMPYSYVPIDYPKVDGSTSTHPLDMVLACEKNRVPWAWVSPPAMDIFTSGAGQSPELRVTPIIGNPRDPEQRGLADNIKMRINHHGTNQGYVALINKQADLILVARAPSEDEFRLAKEKGVELETVPVARDALVFVVNVGNPTESLSMEQLRGVYSGKITSWTETGWEKYDPLADPGMGMYYGRGPSNYKYMDIVPYTRNRNSGSRELLDALVMQGLPPIESVMERDPSMMLTAMSPVIAAMAEDVFGLCYTVYYYEEFMFKSAYVKTIAVDGVAPTAETIGNGTYPLVADVYAVIRKDEAPGSPARNLLEWILSDEGQKAVAKSGYVPIRN